MPVEPDNTIAITDQESISLGGEDIEQIILIRRKTAEAAAPPPASDPASIEQVNTAMTDEKKMEEILSAVAGLTKAVEEFKAKAVSAEQEKSRLEAEKAKLEAEKVELAKRNEELSAGKPKGEGSAGTPAKPSKEEIVSALKAEGKGKLYMYALRKRALRGTFGLNGPME